MNCIGEENTLLIRLFILPTQHVPELLLRFGFLYGYLYGGRWERGWWNVYDVLHDGQQDKAVARMGIGQLTWGFNMQILWTISSICIVKHYFMYCTRHPIFLKLFKNCKIVLLFQCPRDFVSWICSSVLCAAVVVRRDIWSLLREYLLSHWKVKTSWDAHLIWQMFFHQICWIKI